jgi:hypothetical protein
MSVRWFWLGPRARNPPFSHHDCYHTTSFQSHSALHIVALFFFVFLPLLPFARRRYSYIFFALLTRSLLCFSSRVCLLPALGFAQRFLHASSTLQVFRLTILMYCMIPIPLCARVSNRIESKVDARLSWRCNHLKSLLYVVSPFCVLCYGCAKGGAYDMNCLLV